MLLTNSESFQVFVLSWYQSDRKETEGFKRFVSGGHSPSIMVTPIVYFDSTFRPLLQKNDIIFPSIRHECGFLDTVLCKEPANRCHSAMGELNLNTNQFMKTSL